MQTIIWASKEADLVAVYEGNLSSFLRLVASTIKNGIAFFSFCVSSIDSTFQLVMPRSFI